LPRSRTGSRRRGKKADARVEAGHLDWALADFSGYLAADELYDGPFCVLSAVDARQQRRLLYEVLDHDPTQVDILLFLARLHDRIRAHGHTVLGITTDGSPLYPQPIALALGDIPHQVCEFHILKELTKAVLHAVARLSARNWRRKPRSCPTAVRERRREPAANTAAPNGFSNGWRTCSSSVTFLSDTT
jgi:hypothetical protein